MLPKKQTTEAVNGWVAITSFVWRFPAVDGPETA
jgi:hypothetical protein